MLLQFVSHEETQIKKSLQCNKFCEDKKESFQIQKQIFFENFRVSNKRIARNDSSKTKINDSSKTKITHHYFITNEP